MLKNKKKKIYTVYIYIAVYILQLVPFIIIYNMKCIKHYITSKFPKLGFVKKRQGGSEFNEMLTII